MSHRAAFFGAVLLAFTACTVTVRPPAVVADVQPVYIVTHGMSSSLILPDGKNGAVRWAFGDWRYYALGRTDPFSAIAAVLWPTPSALGRQRVEPFPPDAAALRYLLGIGIDQTHELRVNRLDAERLQARLEQRFDSHRETLLFNPGPQLEFVRPDETYTLLNSSNRKLASWLRELGCTISGVPLLANWRIDPTEGTALATQRSGRTFDGQESEEHGRTDGPAEGRAD